MILWRTLYILGALAICILICSGAVDYIPAIRLIAGVTVALAICVVGKVTEYMIV